MALRAVANVKRHYSASTVHKMTNVAWLDVERQKHCCTQVYKSLNGLTAKNVIKMFKHIVHNVETRTQQSCLYRQPLAKTTLGGQNLPVRAYNYWKTIPGELRSAISLASFQYHLKKFNGFVHNSRF